MEKEPSSISQLPPGFRFRPSDEELIVHYLQNKVTSRPLPATIIAEIDPYKHSPWELPSLFCTFTHFISYPLHPNITELYYFLFSYFIQRKLCLEKMNGTSLAREIGSTWMEQGLTEQQLRVTGKPVVLTSQF